MVERFQTYNFGNAKRAEGTQVDSTSPGALQFNVDWAERQGWGCLAAYEGGKASCLHLSSWVRDSNEAEILATKEALRIFKLHSYSKDSYWRETLLMQCNGSTIGERVHETSVSFE